MKKSFIILPAEEFTDMNKFHKSMERVRNGTWDSESNSLLMFKKNRKGDEEE
jgi:hypothetical protein